MLDPWIPPAKAKAATRTTEAVKAIPLPERLGLATDSAGFGYTEIIYGVFEDLGFSSIHRVALRSRVHPGQQDPPRPR